MGSDAYPVDRCLLDPEPFAPVVVDGEVVAASVDLDAALALGLADGQWWTAWSDGISCDRVTVSFVLGDAAEVAP